MTIDPKRILVVDDNKSAAEAISLVLEREGYEATAAFDGETAINAMDEGDFDLVLTDLKMAPIDGMAVVRAARNRPKPVEVIVFSAHGSVEAAVAAMHLGAADFLTKPVTADQLIHRLRTLTDQQPMAALLGPSQAMQELRAQVETLAAVRSTVLITGEIGVGRRHVAKALHDGGVDPGGGILRVAPNTLPELSEAADAGTLVISSLDEWGAGPQQQLLGLLELLDQPPRVIATASPKIEDRVANDEIAPELYFRLAVIHLRIPPLRERPGDISMLLEHYTKHLADVLGREPVAPSAEQLRRLETHGWPGNIRELVNLAERAVVMGPQAFDLAVRPTRAEAPLPALQEGFNLPEHLEEIERTLLIRAMEQTGGDRPEMGRLLGLERNTLRYKLNKYDLLD